MQTSQATLYCPNPHCQAPNPESQDFCLQCQTRLPKCYLWVVGKASLPLGELLADRYQVKGPQVVLDTQPGKPVTGLTAIPPVVEPYLKLFPYRLHIPQVYDLLGFPSNPSQPLILLEQAPLRDSDFATPPPPFPVSQAEPFRQAWPQASPVRQLHWLWQMAQLWQPLSRLGAAASLLQPQGLRVEGPLVRLLELQLDPNPQPSLDQLGQLWLQWLPQAQVTIAPCLEQLCQQLVDQQVQGVEALVAQLDHWLMLVSKSQNYRLDLATATDQGPTRNRNEDACYPADGTQATSTTNPWVIVCDGVGGHAGGDVASNLAIATCRQHLEGLPLESLTPNQLMDELETAVCLANDLISERNDQEQRHDRQRMGTTLVLALARGPEIYIAHVGDSRAYWITPTGCYQVTLDDDVASRDVRMGYNLYRDALRQPMSGSLVQALGMGASTLLQPTVQRLFIDTDCIFLLCSDGLSDYDRVEESWPTEILPALTEQRSLTEVSQRLVELANHQNGHDNVTLGLLQYQVEVSHQPIPLATESLQSGNPVLKPTPATTSLVDSSQSSQRSWLLPLVVTLAVLGLAGTLAFWLLPIFSRQIANPSDPSPTVEPPVSPQPPSNSINVGTFLGVRPGIAGQSPNNAAGSPTSPLTLFEQPGQSQTQFGPVPTGSVLQVIARQTLSDQDRWLRVRVCSAPQAVNPSPRPAPDSAPLGILPTGGTGWIQEAAIDRATELRQPSQLGPNQLSACASTPPTPLGSP